MAATEMSIFGLCALIIDFTSAPPVLAVSRDKRCSHPPFASLKNRSPVHWWVVL